MEITKLQQRELTKLAAEINNAEKDLEQQKVKLMQVARMTVSECVLQGQRLLKAKEIVGYGNFETWLKAYCPRVSPRTFRKYMRLARNAHVLKDHNNLTGEQAIQLCMMEESASGNTPKCGGSVALPRFLRLLYMFSRACKFERLNLADGAPPEIQEKLRKELLPMVRRLWPVTLVSE